MKPIFININTALVTRIDPKKREIAINFDINNVKMVKPVQVHNITKLFYKWMKDIIDEHGKVE